ncbi:hypothetical protein FV218_13925 [Methylobacterium sp. WL69]|uniref:hypothetical protein n=1 Tax=Methylobacterium sp. WL69 TaxID=2603893 RepID=UPI0011CAA423|nr:hypothetical protein [Methylobacterium sp. WL69]TXM72082.1 hypothetical protein FV218_13925 [Methylobacterium sp. WL69]
MAASTESPLRIVDRAGAGALVARVMESLQALEGVLARESDHIRVGRLREGLAEAEHKTGLSAAYLQGLETIKANAIALARFAPEGLEALKAAHRRFTAVVEANQMVLATARAVSEGLVKSLAEEVGRARASTIYGRPAHAPSPYARPGMGAGQSLVLSRSL